jgi:hypothetical protein
MYYKSSGDELFYDPSDEIITKHALVAISKKEFDELLDQINNPPIPVDEQKEIAKRSRAAAYTAEADPLFFKVQRGEAKQQDWEDKVAEIRERFPYPEDK